MIAMKTHTAPALMACLIGSFALSSCDKAKQVADAGLRKIDELRGKPAAGASSATNPAAPKPSLIPEDDGGIGAEWQSQLDRTAEGVVFRKDLPFPVGLTAKTITEEEWDLRVLVKSALGTPGRSLQGTRSSVEEVRLRGDELHYHLVSADWTPKTPPAAPVAAAPAGAKPAKAATAGGAKTAPAAPAAPAQTAQPGGVGDGAGIPASGADAAFELTLRKSADNWVPARPPKDFRAAFAASQLADIAELIPAAYSLAPRPLWFGKHRFKAGMKIPVPESQLGMLLDGKSLQGSLSLTFEQLEGVGGHPCGRFAILGHVRRSGIPGAVDPSADEEFTIESGKIWLSAVYPVILKADWKAIVTRESPGMQLQGTMQKRFVRTWTEVVH